MDALHSNTPEILNDVVFIFLTYNQDGYLPGALQSVFEQTCFPSKLVIMDDASPDNSDKVIREAIQNAPENLNIEYIHNAKNIGLVAQLNKLVDQYKNMLIIVQAGDDESYPNRIEQTYKAWVTNERPSLVLGGYDCIDEKGTIIDKFDSEQKKLKPYTIDRIIRRRVLVHGCCAAFDSELMNFYGPIPEGIINEDRVNVFRAAFQKGIIYVHEPLLRYRSEVGISAFTTTTKVDRCKKIVVEAKRELLDIECHFADLEKTGQSPIKSLLLARKKNVLWLEKIKPSLNWVDMLKAVLRGVSIVVVLKTYKKLNK